MLEYDRAAMIRDLGNMPKAAYLAVAAAAASRLLPFYEAFSRQHRWGNAKALREALNLVWDIAEGRDCKPMVLKRQLSTADKLATKKPRDGFGWDYVCSSLGAAAVASCLDAVGSDGPDAASGTTESAFDAAYGVARYILFRHRGRMKSTQETRRQTTEHPIVQTELERQQRDVSEVQAAGKKALVSAISNLRKRSLVERTVPEPP